MTYNAILEFPGFGDKEIELDSAYETYRQGVLSVDGVKIIYLEWELEDLRSADTLVYKFAGWVPPDPPAAAPPLPEGDDR